uniref:Uncharacterized protein n=1 Tax=Crocodylus porosus TaxID=8502 RepID=A0A7M4EXC7_CROPO
VLPSVMMAQPRLPGWAASRWMLPQLGGSTQPELTVSQAQAGAAPGPLAAQASSLWNSETTLHEGHIITKQELPTVLQPIFTQSSKNLVLFLQDMVRNIKCLILPVQRATCA